MIREYAEIFCWKNVSSFCSAKATHIFSAKNIRILYTESAKIVNEMTLNELVKLTMLWTTGPWILLLLLLFNLSWKLSPLETFAWKVKAYFLLWRQFAWIIKAYFLENKKTIINLSSAVFAHRGIKVTVKPYDILHFEIPRKIVSDHSLIFLLSFFRDDSHEMSNLIFTEK